MRVLLVGAGEVGRKHLALLRAMPEIHVAGVVEPAGAVATMLDGLPQFSCHRQALNATATDLVIAATPPSVTPVIATDAATAGCRVLAEKPVAIAPSSLRDIQRYLPEDADVCVAFQSHFAPGVAELVTTAPPTPVVRAAVTLRCLREARYYTGWRADPRTAGGVLHQQAIHGLALALRLWSSDDPIDTVAATAINRRRWKQPEDRIEARITFASGRELTIAAATDSDQPARHAVELTLGSGEVLTISGRNLEAGLRVGKKIPDARRVCSHAQLRQAMYRALLTMHRSGPRHPSLFPLPDLVRTLEVINRVYTAAGEADHGPAPPALAPAV